MFYRYEARRPGGEWKGICQALTPSHRRKIARFLASPKWYETHPDTDSRCWLTEEGYQKYHEKMEAVIEDCQAYYYPLEVRLKKAETLEHVVLSGKMQCICLAEVDKDVTLENDYEQER